MSDIVIKAENLGKKYTIGHQAENVRYVTLRDVLMQNARSLWHKTKDLAQGKPIIQGDTLEEVWALKDVSFEIQRGETLGIIGRNGAGKSTLLKILSRITEPSSGRVTIKGRVASLLEVGTGFHPELTGRENIYLNGAILGMTRQEIKRKYDEIVAFAEIEKFIDTPVKRYSSGMYVRLAFAVAAHLEPEILLVDEVLAVGDAAFQKKCLGKMGDVAKEGRTVLFVSHNMAVVQRLCSRGILFESGMIAYCGKIFVTVSYYQDKVFLAGTDGETRAAHVIFAKGDDSQGSDLEIRRIEILDSLGSPKPRVYTWDCVRFRIFYYARSTVRNGSAVLFISSQDGAPLLLCSTQPDGTVPLKIEIGEHYVDCEFESLPLSAGDYIVGAGFAIPNKEWLCREESLGKVSIQPRDVYGSGLAPVSTRSILAIPHKWFVEHSR